MSAEKYRQFRTSTSPGTGRASKQESFIYVGRPTDKPKLAHVDWPILFIVFDRARTEPGFSAAIGPYAAAKREAK
jgi:hypothetical protein